MWAITQTLEISIVCFYSHDHSLTKILSWYLDSFSVKQLEEVTDIFHCKSLPYLRIYWEYSDLNEAVGLCQVVFSIPSNYA